MIKFFDKKTIKYILTFLLILLTFLLIYNYTPLCNFKYNNLKEIISIFKDLILAVTPIVALYYTNKNQQLNLKQEETIKKLENEYSNKRSNLEEKKESLIEFIKSVNDLISDYNINNLKKYKTNYYILVMNISKENKNKEEYKDIESALRMFDYNLCDKDILTNGVVKDNDREQLEIKLTSLCKKIFYD